MTDLSYQVSVTGTNTFSNKLFFILKFLFFFLRRALSLALKVLGGIRYEYHRWGGGGGAEDFGGLKIF